MATQAERIAALEQQVAALTLALEAHDAMLTSALRTVLTEALAPVVLRTEQAHQRLDKAREAFAGLRQAVKATQAH